MAALPGYDRQTNLVQTYGQVLRCLFHKYTTSAPGFSLGAPRSNVASGAGLEPGAPRGDWCRTYEMDIKESS